MIGALFVVIDLRRIRLRALVTIHNAIPGVLLIFAGLELWPLVRTLKTNDEYFVALLIRPISLALPSLTRTFGIGIMSDPFSRRAKIRI